MHLRQAFRATDEDEVIMAKSTRIITMTMEAVWSSDISVNICQTTRHTIPEVSHLHAKETVTMVTCLQTYLSTVLCIKTNWGNSVRTVSDYRLDDRRSIPSGGKELFLYPLCPDQLWCPPSLLSYGHRGSFPRCKSQPAHEADHSSHLEPKSRMSRSYTYSPPYYFLVTVTGWYRWPFSGLLCSPSEF
jgi:hypothetical protein